MHIVGHTCPFRPQQQHVILLEYSVWQAHIPPAGEQHEPMAPLLHCLIERAEIRAPFYLGRGCIIHGRTLQLLVGKRKSAGFYNVQRSEEHTSELQSLMRISYAVFCLKKKRYRNKTKDTRQRPTRNDRK